MNKQSYLLSVLLMSIAFLGSCGGAEESSTLDEQLMRRLQAAAPNGDIGFFMLPSRLQDIPQDPRNPLTPEKVALGKLLFHETGLAIHPKHGEQREAYSCASCHHVPGGFQAGVVQGIGDGGLGFGVKGESRSNSPSYLEGELDVQPIRTPSVLNSAFQEAVLWNGQFGDVEVNRGTEVQWTEGTPLETNRLGYAGLETQAIAGMEVHRLGISEELLEKGYRAYFDRAFPKIPAPERYSVEYVGLAIAAYERTLLADKAPFQEWLKGRHSVLSDKEKKGAVLFFGNASCVSCHTGPALNSMEFHALGMPDLQGAGIFNVKGMPATLASLGRGGFTRNPDEYYKFKVPQLYNLTESPFYGHGGNFRSVREVVAYKNEAIPENGKVPQRQLAEGFVPLGLSPSEIDAITAFIEGALHDPDLRRYEPETLPSGNCFPNNDLQSRTDRGCE